MGYKKLTHNVAIKAHRRRLTNEWKRSRESRSRDHLLSLYSRLRSYYTAEHLFFCSFFCWEYKKTNISDYISSYLSNTQNKRSLIEFLDLRGIIE